MKKLVKLKDVDPILFAGTSDSNLLFIENKIKAKIMLRGNEIHLNGSKNEIAKVESLINDMVYTINLKGYINEDDIETLLFSSENKSNKIDSKNGLADQVILYTHKGAVVAQTSGQKKYYKAVIDNDIVFSYGPAGTGKTYQAVACAVSALKNNEVEKIIITRPVVEAGENLGFLPGYLQDKIDPYLKPIYDALEDMIPISKMKKFLENKTIEIAPLAYMRGRTLKNAFILLDEAQNTTESQLKMFLTRLGQNSKMIVTGDVSQIDLRKNQTSGLVDAQKKLKDGDIVNIDVTVLHDGWHGDTSRMFLVGKVAPHAKRLVDITRDCMYAGIEQVKPGAKLGNIGHAIQIMAEKNYYSVVRDYCGHGIGKVYHEEPQVMHYGEKDTGIELKEGMCFTIEPMINLGTHHAKVLEDGWTVVTKDGKLSAQWEHTVAVTDSGYEILTLGEEKVV